MSDQSVNCNNGIGNSGRAGGTKPQKIYKYITSFRCKCMQIHSKPDTDLKSPDTRAVNIQISKFQPSCVLLDAKNTQHFLINMQMWRIRYVCWIELIPATPSACAVITNYRQASDGRLKP